MLNLVSVYIIQCSNTSVYFILKHLFLMKTCTHNSLLKINIFTTSYITQNHISPFYNIMPSTKPFTISFSL